MKNRELFKDTFNVVLIKMEELIAYKKAELEGVKAGCDQKAALSREMRDSEPWCFTAETIRRFEEENIKPLRELVSKANRLFDEEFGTE